MKDVSQFKNQLSSISDMKLLQYIELNIRPFDSQFNDTTDNPFFLLMMKNKILSKYIIVKI